jgi:hypothetical protein
MDQMSRRQSERTREVLFRRTDGTECRRNQVSDFDFWMGSWKIHNGRLRERLKGSTSWDEFESTADARSLLGGLGNEDVFRTDFEGGFTGMFFRFFDKATGFWSIYWTDSRRLGKLDPPVVGRFEGEVGVFGRTPSRASRSASASSGPR